MIAFDFGDTKSDVGNIKLTKDDVKEAARVLGFYDPYDQKNAVGIPSTLIQDHSW